MNQELEIKFMRINLSCIWILAGLFLCTCSTRVLAEVDRGGVYVSVGGGSWQDPAGGYPNSTSAAKLSACSDTIAYAGGGMTLCPDQTLTCAGSSCTAWGSVQVTNIVQYCGPDGEVDSYQLHVSDPTMPGGATITATVSAKGYGDDHECAQQTFTATGTATYDPENNSCTTCKSQTGSQAPASGLLKNDSINFRLNLGPSSPIDTGGFLWLYANLPSTSLSTPSSLQLPFTFQGYQVVTNSAGVILQVNTPLVLANVVAQSTYQYEIQFFYASKVTGFANGIYTTAGDPFDTWTVQNPDGGSSINRLWITEQPANGQTREFQYTFIPANVEWDLLQPDGLTTVKSWRVANVVDSTITNYYTQTFTAGVLTSAECDTYQYVAATGQKLRLQQVLGVGASAQTNTFTYYTSGGGQFRLQEALYANGNWEYCTYDNYGRLVNDYGPYGNTAAPTAAQTNNMAVIGCKLTAYSYPDASIDSSTVNDPFQTRTNTTYIPVYDASGWQMKIVAEGNTIVSPGEYTQRIQYINPSVELDTMLSTVTEYDNQGWWAINKPSYLDNPDGTTTTYAYPDEYTTVEYDPDSTTTTTVVDAVGNPLTVSRNGYGVVLSQLTYNYTNSSGVAYDQIHRSYDVTDLAGRTTSYQYNDCCGSYTVTDADGRETEYADDLLKRPVATTVYYGTGSGIMTSNTLDGAGRVLMVQRVGTDGSVDTLQRMQYDILGNVISVTNALGGVTSTTNVIVNNQLCITNIYPDGGSRTETYYSDGRLQSVMGTGVHPVEYLYGAEQDVDGNWREYTQVIKLAPNNVTNEWTKTYVDGASRGYKTIYSSVGTQNSYSESYYNDYGQLWMQVDPDGVTNMYVIDNNGDLNQGQIQYRITALSATALNVGSYDGLVGACGSLAGGVDQIRETVGYVVPANGNSGQPDLVRTDFYTWTNGDFNDPQGTLVSSSLLSTAGTDSWKVQFADTIGRIAVTNEVKTSFSSPNRTTTVIAPDGSYIVSGYSYGRLANVTRYDSTSAPISGTAYAYDPHGREWQVTDARNGKTSYGYNAADLVTNVTAPFPGNGQSAEITGTLYDKLLRPLIVTQPDNTTLTNSYLLTGELGQQSGSRMYPVAYTYDYTGRMKAMTTWTNYGASTGPAVTTWNYDAYRGWMTNKVYNDGSGPFYSYTPGGRLRSRIWARGIGMTNNYDVAGELLTVTYSAGTPAITNGYNNLGRLIAITNNGSAELLTYNLAGQVLTESYSGGILSGLSVTNGYDQYLRRTNLSTLSSSLLSRTAYGYDNASRLQTVTDGNGDSVGYSYLANSALVGQIAFANGTTSMTTSKQYDYLNRLTQISSQSSASMPPQSFNYSYNLANQRTLDRLADGSYWAYQYDSLGQVTNGSKYFYDNTIMPGQQFNYSFDTIGNRKQTKVGGDQNAANQRLANYMVNSLNEITNRYYSGTNDVVGVALATNTVTVNNQTAWRKGEYFWATVSTNNTGSAEWEQVTVASGGNNSAGGLYVAQTPECFKYDLDGNLLSDGRWNYTWDGENRLVAMTNNTGVGPLYGLAFIYDAKGRRIEKLVATNSGTAYVGQYTNRFLYDGWNPVVVLNPQSAIVTSFAWGNDLSGSLQGAGGIGGLLAVSYHGTATTNCFVDYDGNGNVAGLVNAPGGTSAATYEYGPFGELIRQTGPMAKVNPFRFSTKYQDDESDLLYYGYRYYKASTGTWLSRDPLAEVSSLNLFEFVQNDSINKGDYIGLSTLLGLPAEIAAELEAGIPASQIAEEYGVSLEYVEEIAASLKPPVPPPGPLPIPPIPIPIPVPAPQPNPSPSPTPAPPAPPITCSVCPPCTPYAVGTVGFLGPHNTKPSAPPGAPRPTHYNLFVVNQQPAPGCHCFWNRYPPHYWATQGPATVNLNSGFPTLSP